MSVITGRSDGHTITEPLPAADFRGSDTVTKTFEKALLKSVNAPAGTSLSHQINYEVYSLRKVPSFKTNGKAKASHAANDEKSDRTAAIPAFFKKETISQKKVVVAQPCLEEPANQKMSPLSLRPSLPKKWSFRRLGPGLSNNYAYIPSTVLGDAEKYSKVTYAAATKSDSLVNKKTKHFLNAAPILQQRNIETRSPKDPFDATSRCLARFEQTALQRRKLAKTLATRLNRRIEDLVLSDVDNFCGKKERRAVSEVQQGPRSVYETLGPGLQPIGGVDQVVPELLSCSPYDKLTFTEKPHSLKVLTGSASEDGKKTGLCRTDGTYRRTFKQKLSNKKTLPPGIRQPSFNNLLISGTNQSHLPQGHRWDDSVSGFGCCVAADSSAFGSETGRDPIVLCEKLPEDGKATRTDSPTRASVLEISSTNDNDTTITRKPDGVDILIKLFAEPQGIATVTSLVLTNSGPEALSFGLLPYDYPNPLWPTERTGMIYFIHPSGLLEAGGVHTLTAAFECHVNGNFAESYKMWLLPKGSKPDNIVIVVCGTSTSSSPIQSRSQNDTEEICHQYGSPSMVASLATERHMKDLLREADGPAESGTIPTLEEKFTCENNLKYQSEAVTKLQYIWIFAHLLPENIPWYQSLIDMEKLHKGGLPGEITKIMLEELAAAQQGMQEAVINTPDYLYDKVPSTAEGVYWRKAKETTKCDIHDKDFPLPDSSAKRNDAQDHTAVVTVLPEPNRRLPATPLLKTVQNSTMSPTATPALFTENDHSNPLPFQRTLRTMEVVNNQPRQSKVSDSGSDWVPIKLQPLDW